MTLPTVKLGPRAGSDIYDVLVDDVRMRGVTAFTITRAAHDELAVLNLTMVPHPSTFWLEEKTNRINIVLKNVPEVVERALLEHLQAKYASPQP